jgi:germination protein M
LFLRRTSVVFLILIALGGCRRTTTPGAATTLQNRVVTRTITLYFESPQMHLVAEQRTLPLPENEAAAAPVVVRELLKGSVNAAIPRLFPTDVQARGTYTLPDGTAVVDLGGATLVNGWGTGTHGETMAIYSIVQTLTANFRSIKRVRIVVNGQPAQTLAGHIDLSRPFYPRPALLRP